MGQYIMSNREIALREWVNRQLDYPEVKLIPLCGDASFRRYFRIYCDTHSYIVMDAPPEVEALSPFIHTANILRACGVRVPEIHRVNQAMGFAVLEDFGDQLLLNVLTQQNADRQYSQAIDELLLIQNVLPESILTFPEFNREFMQNEMMLCIEWFIKQYLKYPLSTMQQSMLQNSFDIISQQIAQQPQVLIHRDYHSRNIMCLQSEDGLKLGLIDFQDAMKGPYSYDLVSLYKDCYIEWPRENQLRWLRYYYERSPINQQLSFHELVRDYDYCGLQRHLKVLGIFSRLYLRDGKDGYLKNVPLTLKYILNCLEVTGWLPEMFHFFQRIPLM